MSKPIHVIGHRSPDTDSICSAIAYAQLKQALGENAVPARAGKINAETKYVLDTFHIAEPVFIDDLYPRVKDVMSENSITVLPENNLRELGQVMKRHNVKSVPVVTGDSSLVGIVSVGDLAKRYFDELEMQDLCEAGVDFAGIVRVVDGTVLCGGNLMRNVPGKVRIAAARPTTMRSMIHPGEVVLVGDRAEAHLAAMERDISCLIITGNAEAEPQVRDIAERRGVIIIQSPYDTYTCARLINQSIPVGSIMQKEIVCFKPTDLLVDIKSVIVKTDHRNYPVVENGKLAGLVNRDRLIVPEREKIILVDHNELAQAVDGVQDAQIVEIIDHHRLGGMQTGEPIYIRHEPVGSTATIITGMYTHCNVDLPKAIAGLLLSAIVSDTLLFKSPTTTLKDRETAAWLTGIAGLQLEEFGLSVLKAGANLGGLSAAEIVGNDLKEFEVHGFRMAISQISVTDPETVLSIRREVLEHLHTMQAKEQYDMAALMVTDIINEGTYLMYTGQPHTLLTQAFGYCGEDHVVYLPDVLSRKKQVLPPLIEALKQYDRTERI